MKSNRNNHLCTAIKVAGFAIAASSAVAADLTWDTVPGDGAIITAGSGTWDTSATAWNDAGTDAVWSQTSPTSGSNTATLAGTDGTVDPYVITLGEAVAAQSITFNSSGYQITGGTLALMNGALNGSIAVAAGKTATIDATLRYNHNVAASLTVGPDAVLNLGGGTTTNFDPQLSMSGAGTVNFTAGNFRSNIANVNVANVNLTGGTYRYSPGNNTGATIGNNPGRNVNYTVSGSGTLVVSNNAGSGTGTPPSFLRLGNATTPDYTATLTIQAGGTMTIGSGKAGELQISGSAASNGKFDVQGGTVTIANGTTSNKIYFFKAGAAAAYTATMTQSEGTVTANGIEFGGATGTYDATSSATLTLSGGSLYVGAQGITRGSAATDLPVTIRLQGGTLGADQNWTSSLGMKLGVTGGGPAIRAQNSGGTGRTIFLSGDLSNDGAVDGTLTKTGSGDLTLSGTNTYSGGTTIHAGRLFIANAAALPATGAVQINSGGRLGLNAADSPNFNQSITLASGGTLSMRQAATVTNITLPTAGLVNFNRDNATTVGFTLDSDIALTGDLTIEVGGGGTPATAPVNLAGDISGAFGLTKAQPGTLVLSGANSYSGNTTISAGMLSLGQINTSNELSTVTIASGATLELTYEGTDTVDKLFFGTTQQPSGIYSASSVPAGATIAPASFSGSGTLTVSSGPGGFSSWITGTFTNGTVPSGKQDTSDDFDNDGIPNLVEYAIAGEDPTVPNPNIGSFNGTLLSFSKRPDASGLTYAIEESTDLGIADDWDEVGSYTENTASTISYTLTPGTPPKNFLRLRVSQ